MPRLRFEALLKLTLSCCFRLLLALNAGLFIMLSLTKLSHKTGLLALTLKAAKCAIKSFIFFYSDFCHRISPPFAFGKETFNL